MSISEQTYYRKPGAIQLKSDQEGPDCSLDYPRTPGSNEWGIAQCRGGYAKPGAKPTGRAAPFIRNRLQTAADARLTDADCQRLAAMAFLHDIGKVHPGFQAKGWPSGSWWGPKRGHLKEGWAFLTLASKWPDHPFHKTMLEIRGWGVAVVPLFAAMIAHHGRPVEQPPDPTLHDWPCLPHYDWRVEARVMDGALHQWFAGAFEPGGEPLPDRPRFHHTVAGLE